jgi:hypothetical protein
MKTNLVENWLEHCRQAGHITQAEAVDKGFKVNRKKHAAFSWTFSGNTICCSLCEWEHTDEEKRPA